MIKNKFQRGEDVVFNVNTTHIEGYTAETEVQLVLYPADLDLSKESSAAKIVVLEPVTDESNLVFTFGHEQTATAPTGEYSLELVYTINNIRSIMKSERCFTLEDSATVHISNDGEGE